MVLIDQLIHSLHGELSDDDQRTGAHYLIEGRSYREVWEFLEELSYGDESTSQVLKRKNEWARFYGW